MSDKQAQASRYAQAILRAMLERWDGALGEVEKALEADPKLSALLQDRSKDKQQKQDALNRALPSDTPAEVINLLMLMGQEGDLALVPEVARSLGDAVSGQQAPEKADVVSAVELSDADKEQLRRKLIAEYGDGLVFSFRVDPALMGGLRVRVGDHLIDTSVASRLATLRESLTSAVR